MAEEQTTTQTDSKPIIFNDIDPDTIQLPSESKKETANKEKTESAEKSSLEEDDILEDGEAKTSESSEKGFIATKKQIGENELEEDEVEEEQEEPEEEQEEKDEDTEAKESDAEEEYIEMSAGGVAKALSKLPPKELEKVLSGIEVPVRVDGEDKIVDLAELKRSYASRASTTKEYYRVKEWKDKIQNELAVINNTLGPAWQCVKEKKIENALLELAKIAGYSTLEVKRQLRAEMAESILKYAQMTPEQRKQFDLEEEVAFSRQQEKERKEKEEKAREAIEREQSRYRFQAEHGISDAQYNEAANWLLKNRLNGDASRLTAEGILDYIVTAKAVDTALALIERERPSLRENDAFTDRVIRLCKKYPTASWAQLGKKVQEIASEYLPKKEKDETELRKDIGRKVLKTKPKSALQNPDKQKTKPKTFDDILP